ncbi:site-specific integrase [Pseudoalteromonas sp. C2R02]|uniref:site-specific integrase n=1 Tax=Pseudoalteromonas sp. C2R02 TaxID=2841565 RepID=UPI001C08B01E|nr:site-specific integrase [Pseudoalteromonas sp. C2R02]MBU2970018.1 site-specific integrase [Pseudoalteromonas sp. C2R02]
MKELIKPLETINAVYQKVTDTDNKVISYYSDGEPFSYYKDDIWLILKEDVKLNFGNLSNGFKSVCKRLIFKLLNCDDLISKKSIGMKYIQAFSIFDKCIIECGGTDFTFINSDKGFRDFIKVAQSRNLKYKTWKNYLIILSVLKKEGVISRVINNADELAVLLANSHRISHQTIALPENIASNYFKVALDVVAKYHPSRRVISDTYESFIQDYNKNIEQGYGVPTARGYAQKNYQEQTKTIDFKLDLTGQWLSLIRAACYIVIAGFTGCRDGEVKSLTIRSYQEKKYGGMVIPVVNGIHTKVNVAGVERQTSWVTIPAVQQAIELIYDIYEFSRNAWKERAKLYFHIDEQQKMIKEADSLFLSYSPTARHPSAGRQGIECSLKSFVKFVNYRATSHDVTEFNLLNPSRKDELKVGETLIPNPHCFRRTFAVYIVRNKLASLLDLKYQFKHLNIFMTSWYSNQANVAGYFDMMLDKELLLDIAQENHEFMTDTLYHIYNEAESLSGAEGKRIESLRGEDRSTIYLSRDEISKQVRDGQMSIIETPVGHCTNPRCDRICDAPVCKYAVVTKTKALELLPKRNLLITKFESLIEFGLKMPNILSKLYYEIKSIEQCFKDHNIAFDVFKHDINQTLL